MWKRIIMSISINIILLLCFLQLSCAGTRKILGEPGRIEGINRVGDVIVPDPGISLGDSSNRFKDIWVEGSSIHLGDIELKENDNDQGLEVGNRLHLTPEGSVGGSVCLHPGESPDANPTGARLWVDSSGNLQILEANANPNVKVNTPIVGVNIYNRTTGWLEGGQITINGGDNTKIDITAGSVLIVDSSTPIPTLKIISWASQTALDPTLTTRTKWVGVKDDGAGNAEFVYDVQFDSVERRTTAIIGKIRDEAGTGPQITNIDDFERPAWGLLTTFQDFILEYGSWNISGNVYSANGANLLLDKSPGTSFRYHAEDTIGSENVHTDAAQSPRTSYAYHLQNTSTTIAETAIDPDNYDNNGVKTALPNNQWTVQEVWYWPVSGGCHVLYGQIIYNSKEDAIVGITTETKTRNTSILDGAILRAYLVLEKDCTDLTDSATAEIREAGMAAGGSGGSALWTRTGITLSPTNIGDGLATEGDISISNLSINKSFRIADSSGNLDAVITRQATTNDVYIGDINNNGGKLHFYADGSEAIIVSEDGAIDLDGSGVGGLNPHIVDIKTPATGGLVEIGTVSESGPRLYFQNLDNKITINSRNNYPLTFAVNNIERARFDTSGNFGIGTTLPTGKLDVRGQIVGGTYAPIAGLSVKLDLASHNTNPTADFLFPDGGKFRTTEDDMFGTNDIFMQAIPTTGAGHGIVEAWTSAGMIVGTGGNAAPVIFQVNRVEKARIDAIGLGIGKNPDYALDVAGKINATDDIYTSAGIGIGDTTILADVDIVKASPWVWLRSTDLVNGEASIALRSGTAATGYIRMGDTDSMNSGRLSYDHATDSMSFITSETEQLRIDSSGNIGIGTTSPDSPLHILSSDDFGGDDLIIEKDADVATGLKIKRNESGGSFNESWYMYMDGSSTDLRFYGNGDDRFTITNNGEVGIRTPPSEGALHIRQLTSEFDGGLTLQDPAGPPTGITLHLYTTNANSAAIQKGDNTKQIELLGDGMVAFNSTLGIKIGDGADTDQDLITVSVTGTPKFWWDEATDSFEMNKTLTLPQASLRIGTSELSEVGGELNISGGMKADSLDVEGEAKIYADGFGGVHFEAPVSPGSRIDIQSLGNDVNIMAGNDVNIASTGSGLINIPDYTKLGNDAPAIKMKKLTGTTAATEGGFTSIPHGLTQSKILGIQVLVNSPIASALILPETSEWSGNEYSVLTYATSVFVKNHDTNSEGILSAPITILITYEG